MWHAVGGAHIPHLNAKHRNDHHVQDQKMYEADDDDDVVGDGNQRSVIAIYCLSWVMRCRGFRDRAYSVRSRALPMSSVIILNGASIEHHLS